MIEIEEEYENIAKVFCVKKQDVIDAIQHAKIRQIMETKEKESEVLRADASNF